MERARGIDTPAQEGAIRCEGVSKVFYNEANDDEHRVIDHFDLTVKENEFVVLFGPGQCGKTTLINIMAGLEGATSGKVFMADQEVTAPGAERGVVYQTIALFPWRTVLQNVCFGPEVRGVSKKERVERAKHYIDLVGLTGFENVHPARLSGGMKQRVGIARAYCNNPSVLLMDEPFGHLDAQTRYMMEEELMKIWQKDKRTVVFVTNNIEEALYLADRIVLLRNCPTSIKEEYTVDLERPRSYVDKQFLELREIITSEMDNTI